MVHTLGNMQGRPQLKLVDKIDAEALPVVDRERCQPNARLQRRCSADITLRRRHLGEGRRRSSVREGR
jgi:hypothetical protein